MTESWRSLLLGIWPLWILAVVAGVVAGLRKPEYSPDARGALVRLFLIGVALQCGHFLEEYHTGFWRRWPQFLGLPPWPEAFFVTFNLSWIGIWVLSAAGVLAALRLAFVPVWFFAFGMTVNGIAHPLLALAAGGYFPGLWTSPAAGIVGIALLVRLTRTSSST